MCCVIVYGLETSRMGAPYIYDISRLRVNCSLNIIIPFMPSTLRCSVHFKFSNQNSVYLYYLYHAVPTSTPLPHDLIALIKSGDTNHDIPCFTVFTILLLLPAL